MKTASKLTSVFKTALLLPIPKTPLTTYRRYNDDSKPTRCREADELGVHPMSPQATEGMTDPLHLRRVVSAVFDTFRPVHKAELNNQCDGNK